MKNAYEWVITTHTHKHTGLVFFFISSSRLDRIKFRLIINFITEMWKQKKTTEIPFRFIVGGSERRGGKLDIHVAGFMPKHT